MPQLEQTEIFSSLIFWSILSFAILLYLLKRYVFPPIMGIIEAREKRIRNDIDRAERLQKDAKLLRTELYRELQKAHEKSDAIVQMAQDQARKTQEKVLSETQMKCRQMQEDVESEIKRTQGKLLGEIRVYAAALTIASTEKILKKIIGEGDRKRLVNESIEEALREIERKA
ncbi:MAG: F0F1 ATP synthase subunit B [Nitrospinales bacterium]